MRYDVRKRGRLGARGGTPYAKLEDALRDAEHLVANKQPGETVTLEDRESRILYDEAGIAEIRKAIDDA